MEVKPGTESLMERTQIPPRVRGWAGERSAVSVYLIPLLNTEFTVLRHNTDLMDLLLQTIVNKYMHRNLGSN